MVITKSAAEFQAIFDNDQLEVLDFVHLNGNRLDRVVYRKKEPFQQPPSTNAIHIAVFVTSHARRRLYARMTEAIEKGLDLIYCDSMCCGGGRVNKWKTFAFFSADSLIFKRKCWQPSIVEGNLDGGGGGEKRNIDILGEFLGDMKNEMSQDRQITSFVAGGPKNYAYLHRDEEGKDEKLVLRVRGFELNYRARAKLTFRRILKMVLNKYGPGERRLGVGVRRGKQLN